MLRLAVHNFPIAEAVADPLVLAPLVELVVADTSRSLVSRRMRGPEQDSIPELLVTWLRVVNLVGTSNPDPLRARLRARLLASSPSSGDELVIEMLATLGSDLDADTEALLRDLASTRPQALAPTVERPYATRSLARHQPDLLLYLAESYYIEQPRGRYRGLHDDGVRDHEIENGLGFGWWRGPFMQLLLHVPVAAVAFIQRMLNVAAERRAQQMTGHRDVMGEPLRAGTTLDLPHANERFCYGDSHVWFWYRPRSVGPYPCKSALLAIEQFIEQKLRQPDASLNGLAAFVLEGCENLAMPGLVFNVLVRHLERDETAIDRWLVQPDVWELEFARSAQELGHSTFGPDAPVTAIERRSWTPREVAMTLMASAVLRGDKQRISQIAALGPELLAAATPLEASVRPAVATWAAHLDPTNYHLTRTPEGQLVLEYIPPAELADASSDQQKVVARAELQVRLWSTYSGDPDRAGPVGRLIEDLVAARAMAAEPESALEIALIEGLTAIATAALRVHADDRLTVSDDDLAWAAELLLTLVKNEGLPHRSPVPDERGANRSTGIGLPTLLHPRLRHLNIDSQRRDKAIMTCATSRVDDLRDGLVTGLAPLWGVLCDAEGPSTDICVHRAAWTVVEQLAEQPTGSEPIAMEPITETAPHIRVENLQPLLLTAPIVASADATHSACSAIAERARDGHAALLDAHRRRAPRLHGAPETFQQVLSHHQQVTHVLLAHAARGNPTPLRDHLDAYLDHPDALRLLLSTALQTFTHHVELRAALPDLWPPLMKRVMDHVEQHLGGDTASFEQLDHGGPGERLVPPVELIPHPAARMFASDARQAVADATGNWIPPQAVTTEVQRWIRASLPSTAAVEALLGLIATTDPTWQATTGLLWITRLLAGRYQNASRSTQLVAWIQDVHEAGLSIDETLFNPLVDGLIAHGASRLVELQRRVEG